MLCILALETNQTSHLTKIDKTLYNNRTRPGHRRCISQPFITTNAIAVATQIPRKSILSHIKKTSRTFDYGCSRNNSNIEKAKAIDLRRCKSLPNHLNYDTADSRPRSKTITDRSCKYSISQMKLQKKVSFCEETAKEAIEQVPFFEYRDSASSTNSSQVNMKQSIVPIHLVKVDDIKIHTDYRYTSDYKTVSSPISPASSNSSFKSSLTPKKSFFGLFESPLIAPKVHSPEPSMSASPTEMFLTEAVVPGEKMRSKSTIVPPNLLRDIPVDEGRKRKSSRQNLSQFIHSLNSCRQKVELERENLHFHLSEAIISTCQQIKWNKLFDEKYKIPRDCRIKQSLAHNNSVNNLQPPAKIQEKKFIVGSVEDDTESSLSSEEVALDKR